MGRERQVPARVAKKPVIGPVRQHRPGTAIGDREEPHEAEREDEDRKREKAMRHNPVDLIGERRAIRARSAFLHRPLHETLDKLIALGGDDRLGVVLEFLLAIADMLLNMLEIADPESEALDDVTVALEELDRIPADRMLGDERLDRLLDVRERVLDGSAEDMRHLGCAMRGDLRHERRRSLVAAVALLGGDTDDLTVQRLPDAGEVNGVAVPLDDIHHIDGHHHRQPQFRELRREIEVALEVRAIYDVQDRVRLLLDEVLARDLLLQRIRRKRIDAGQVLDDDVLFSPKPSLLLLDRHARPVADVLVGPSQRVEERGLARVRVACQGDFDRHS